MRGFSGRATSLLANYDQSLLVLVLGALVDAPCADRRCTAVPWRTVGVQQLPTELQRYVAAGNLALIDAKLRDDIADGGRWYARIARWVLRRSTGRAARELRRLGFRADLVESLPERQAAIECDTQATLAQLAEPSCELLGEVFAHGASIAGAVGQRKAVTQFGCSVAMAVYAFDALEDHDEDRARERFNAVARQAERVGHVAAVHAVQRALELAVIEAQQSARTFLAADRLAIVTSILQQMTVRAERLADQLTGRPTAAAVRPAEAGDCDCACGDGCCDGGCDGAPCSVGSCDGCCDAICCFSDRDQRRKQQRDNETIGVPPR